MLGAREPRHLMPPTPDNPKGYWESVVLMDFHDRLLHEAKSAWDDWTPIPPEWFASDAAGEARRRIPQIVSQEFGDAPLLLLKDPRVCRLMPVWTSALRDEGIEPLVVLTVRDAAAVAESLHRRDGFVLQRGLMLWLRHVLDAELYTRDVRRTFVRYDALLADWRSEITRITSDLDVAWPNTHEESAGDIDKLLDRSLRHHTTPDAGTTVSDGLLDGWIRAVSAAMDDLCRPEVDAAGPLAELDRVRADFDQAANAFRDTVHDELHQLRTTVADVRADLAHVQRQQSALAEEAATTQAALDQERRTSVGQAARLSDLEGQLVVLHGRTQERIEELAKLTRRMLQAEQRVKRVKARKQKQVLRLQTLSDRQRAQLVARDKELLALHESTSWRVTAPLRTLSGRVRGARLLPAKPSRKN